MMACRFNVKYCLWGGGGGEKIAKFAWINNDHHLEY